jgi:hypothetical protein
LWIANIDEKVPFQEVRAMANHVPVDDSVIESAISFVERHPSRQNFDGNLLYLMAASRSFIRGDTTAVLKYYSRLNVNTLLQSGGRYDLSQRTRFYNYMLELSKHLALNSRTEDAVKIIERFNSPYLQQLGYAEVANSLYDDNYNPDTFIFLDSALSKWRSLDNTVVPENLEFRHRFARVFEKIGGDRMIAFADRMIQETSEPRKVRATQGLIVGSCERSDFFHANASISPSYTEGQDLECKTIIMLAGAQAKERQNNLPPWKAFDNFFSLDYIYFLGQPL